MNLSEQNKVWLEEIALLEQILSEPNLGEALRIKTEERMFLLTGFVLKKPVQFVAQSESPMVKHGLFKKEPTNPRSFKSNSRIKTWDTKTAKYI